MIKKRGFQFQNRHRKGHRREIMMLGIVFLTLILCINLISAFDFDNRKEILEAKGLAGYNNIKIGNFFGLGKVLWEGSLDKNTESCATNCEAIQTITLYEKGVLIEEIIFKTLQDDESWVEQSIRSYQVYVDDKPYKLGTELDAGTYEVRLEGEKRARRTVDWIYKTQGETLDEWAVWGGDFPSDISAYYPMDEDAISPSELGYVNDSVDGLFNITEVFGIQGVNGIIGNGFRFNVTVINSDAYLNDSFPDLQENGSISVWINYNKTATPYSQYLIGDGRVNGMEIAKWFISPNYKMFWAMENGSTNSQTELYSNSLSNDTWQHFVFTWNITSMEMYQDGVSVGRNTSNGIGGMVAMNKYSIGADFNEDGAMNGSIDELGIWNRSLTADEVSTLYNSGAGFPYTDSGSSITINSPVDNFNSTKFIFPNCSANVVGGALLENITYSDNSSGTFEIKQTNSTVSVNSNTTVFNVSLPLGNHKWSCGACDSDSDCALASENRTARISNMIVDAESYPDPILEGTEQTFFINVTSRQTTLTPFLIYNGTSYLGSFTQNGLEFYCSRTLDIPTVSADVNVTFFWSFLMGDGAVINSSSNNVSVLNFGIDDCSANSVMIMNLSLRDEENNTVLVVSDSNIEVELDIYSLDNVLIGEYNNQWINESNITICVENLTNANYLLDMVGSFSADDRVNEFYYIDQQQINLSVTPINISLMDLLTADSTSFLFNYFNLDGLLVDNMIVGVWRKYIGEGLFREIERAKQNDDGDTIIHLVEEDVIYYFTISQNSTIIFTSTTYTALCDVVPCIIQLEEGGEFAGFSENYDLVDNGGYTMTSNSMTREVNLTFATTSPSTFNLTVYKLDDNSDVEYVGSAETTGTSGSLIVTVPQISGNTSFFGSVYQDDNFIKSQWVNFEEDAGLYFGNTLAIFLGFLIILCLGLMAMNEGSSVIVFLILGMVITMILGLIDYRTSVGINILVYIILAGGLILWKLTKKGSR